MSIYEPYYEGGWKNLSDKTTPICAEALNHMEEGIGSASLELLGLYPTETASGPIAVIHDGAEGLPVRDLSVAIEPVQSLNGYDKPWAGGAGKNLLPIDRCTTEANGITFTRNADGTITANGTATAQAQMRYRGAFLPAGNYKFNGCPAGGDSNTYHVYAWDYTTGARPTRWDGTTGSANDVGTGFQEIKVLEGHEVAINCRIMTGTKVTNIVFKPMIVKSSETDATYEPYSNICPITGWDAVKVMRTGANLLPTDKYSAESNGITFTKNADGTIKATGTATANAQARYRGVFLPAGRYLFGGCPAGGDSNTYHVYAWDYTTGARPTRWDGATGSANDVGTGYQEILVETGHEISITCRILSGTTVNDLEFHPIILAEVDAGTTWTPSEAEVTDITLPTTVYGGTLDVTTGILTVTEGVIASYAGETLPGVWISDRDVYAAGTTPTTGAQVVYDLASPQTYTLTPVQVKTLLGENRIYADAGQVTVQYRGEIKQIGVDPTLSVEGMAADAKAVGDALAQIDPGGGGGGGSVTVDTALSSTSTNPVQNKAIYAGIQAVKTVATTSANGLMSSTDKGRLDTIYADYSSALTALG